MISVILSAECRRLAEMAPISEEEIRITVNERHRGMITQGLDRILAAHWFTDERIVFVESVVTKKEDSERGHRVYFREVRAELALQLTPILPGGNLTKQMSMEKILPVVAASFGQPITCHPGEPPCPLYSGQWDGETMKVAASSADIFVAGTFHRQESRAECVWAFDRGKYERWLGKSVADTSSESVQREGTVAFVVKHADADWSTNQKEYDFGRFEQPGIAIVVKKHADGSVQVAVAGPLGRDFTFRKPCPDCAAGDLFVAVTWKEHEVNLYLNGQLAESQRADECE